MSLRDKACPFLTLVQSPTDPSLLELREGVTISHKGEVRYGRVRKNREGEVYSSELYDALSGALLASGGYISDRIKSRRLELHGPDETIPFDHIGRISFEWTFNFEGNKYIWKKSGKDLTCVMDRKPDPPVELCLARQGDSRSPGKISFLHYNIDRFLGHEIKDLRGLETLFIMSLCLLIDSLEAREQERKGSGASAVSTPSKSSTPVAGPSTSPLPPLPQSHTPPAIPVVTDEDYEAENPNEIVVGTHTDLDAHIARACNLLEESGVLFIIIRTRKAEAAQRALQVSLGVTRFRHRQRLKELHQYVIEEEPEVKGPRVINLDDRKPGWTPPPNLAIYLSTIELPDLLPANRKKTAHHRPAAGSAPVPVATSKPMTAPQAQRPPPQQHPAPAGKLAPPPNVPSRPGSGGAGQGPGGAGQNGFSAGHGYSETSAFHKLLFNSRR